MWAIKPNRPKSSSAGQGGGDPPRGGKKDPLPERDFMPDFDEADEADDTPPEDELIEFVFDRDADFSSQTKHPRYPSKNQHPKTFNTQKRKLRHFRDGLM